jgi:hypothetical protein
MELEDIDQMVYALMWNSGGKRSDFVHRRFKPELAVPSTVT